MAGLSPKRSLSVARMIRAVFWSPTMDRPEDLFNVTDRRTLMQLMKLGDSEGRERTGIPRTIDEFLARQRWVTSPTALDELKRALSSATRWRLRVDEDDESS
jgi:hypothetical protein